MRNLTLLACTLFLTACGFQLRGSSDLPFDTLYIALPETTELHAQLARTVRASSKTRIVGAPDQAQAIFTVTGDIWAKNIMSLNTAGRVREYQLVRTFSFRVHNAKGQELAPPGQIILRRDITFADDQILSKENEEALLRRDMQNDLVQQLLRRLSAAKQLQK
jgi:LPS-assembly lipoprotein